MKNTQTYKSKSLALTPKNIISIPVGAKKLLIFGFLTLILYIFMAGGNALATTTVYLEDIDSGLTSPTGNYRWLDVADQAYSAAYQHDYNYT